MCAMRMKKGDGNGEVRGSAETAREWKTPVNMQIFVSHRIDLDAELIDNPLYVPVRCGAVYDRRENISMLGDDTGDNISEKRLSFCEFTVQYWAWKNVNADYYGLCHYRRYLSFARRRFSRVNAHNMIEVPLLTRRTKARYGLLDAEAMRREIGRYDMIVSEPGLVERIPTYTGEQVHTVRQLWEAHEGVLLEKHSIDILLKLIKDIKPEYVQIAKAYFNGNKHIGYNCFIMKKSLFDQLCEFEFPILFQLEQILSEKITKKYPRIIGYIGEMLYGIFVYNLLTLPRYRIEQTQIIMVIDARKIKGRANATTRIIAIQFKRLVKNIGNYFLPVGTSRRKWIKKVKHK